MMDSLHIKMINKPHPYSGTPGSENEIWGRIIIFCQSDEVASILVDTEWDLALFSEWFVTNIHALCSEKLAPPGDTIDDPGNSLAETLSELHQKEFEQDEEELEFNWFDYLFQYSSRHNLWNSLMGSRIPNILIGCNQGYGEISFYGDEKKWHYKFNMGDFIREAKQEIEKFLNYQKRRMESEIQGDRINSILERMPEHDFQNCC